MQESNNNKKNTEAFQQEEVNKLRKELHAANKKLLETSKKIKEETEKNNEIDNYSRRQNQL